MDFTDSACIKATFHNTKRIASRKAYQIILEVPEEMQGDVHRAFGYPNSSTSTWVAVVRLKTADEVIASHECPTCGEDHEGNVPMNCENGDGL